MEEERKCPKCGRTYMCPPAKSRDDGKPICPVCGVIEAMEATPLPEEEKKGNYSLRGKDRNRTG